MISINRGDSPVTWSATSSGAPGLVPSMVKCRNLTGWRRETISIYAVHCVNLILGFSTQASTERADIARFDLEIVGKREWQHSSFGVARFEKSVPFQAYPVWNMLVHEVLIDFKIINENT